MVDESAVHGDDDRKKVLFVSSNGAGMGHITRLLAIANRTVPVLAPVFLSMSQAVPVVGDHGHPWSYCPSQKTLGISSGLWNPLFTERFQHMLDVTRPAAVVFDGTSPYRGIVEGARKRSDVAYVWSRRGMWRQNSSTRYMPPSGTFDLVLEPGEAAASYDSGPTAIMRDSQKLAPVTLLRQADLLDRDEARRELGIPHDAFAVLVTLGAGNINDTRSDLTTFADAAASELPGALVYATHSPIATTAAGPSTGVTTISVYPLARSLRAFDLVIAAAGYNVFHEVLLSRIPAVFVPNLMTTTDDQLGRCKYAQDNGLASWVSGPDLDAARSAIRRALECEVRPGLPWISSDKPANGADEAAYLLEALVGSRR